MMMKLFSLALVFSCLSLISAHVTVSPSQVSNSGSTMLTFNVPHSCDSKNDAVMTNKLVFVFPPDISSIKPVMKAGWMINRTAVDLGYTNKAGVEVYSTTYTYTASPGYEFPTWIYDAVYFRVTASSWTVGTQYYIPVYQYCTNNLLSSWNSTVQTSSDTGSSLPAPSFTVLDPSAIQIIPTQANVQSLASQLATLTNSTSALNIAVSSMMSSHTTTDDWIRADTISVIAIILAGIAVLACVGLIYKISRVEEQNVILRKKLHSISNDKEYTDKPLQKDAIQLTPKETHGNTPITMEPVTTRPSTSEGHDDVQVTLQVHDQQA